MKCKVKIIREERGVSPIVAAILVIGITVAIAGVFHVWLTSYTTNIQSGIQDNTETQSKITDITLMILDYNSKNNIIMVKNSGTKNATDVKVYINGVGGALINAQTRGILTPGEIGTNKTTTLSEGDLIVVSCKEGSTASYTVR
ncbi:MAG: archaellin/type IV pilin N-terminal domain-containing protein [Candidatus Hydrothermarchaeota archaeon]